MIIARLLTPDDAIVTETELPVIVPIVYMSGVAYKACRRSHPSREANMLATDAIAFHYSPLETELYNLLTDDKVVIYRQEDWS